MSLSEIIQTSAILISLLIALSGWFINWRQRVNDKRPQMVATVVNSMWRSHVGQEPIKIIQLRNVGQSTAIVQEFRILEQAPSGNRVISDGSKNLNLPMFPTQMIDSNRTLNMEADYMITVKYTQLNSKRLMTFEVTLSGRVFRHIDPHQLVNNQ